MPRLLLPLAVLVAVLAAAPADAVYKAPCRPDVPEGAKCLWWKATVKAVDDGDTLKVKMKKVRRVDVRVTGINAPELTKYSHVPSERRGFCHGVEATAWVESQVAGSKRHIRLAAQRKSSRSGRRIRRSVWVKKEGKWRDLGAMSLEAGWSLWLHNNVETAHNRQYAKIAALAVQAQRNIYDPDACGAGPDDDIPVSMRVNWDANGNDEKVLNGEYVDIRNDGDRDLDLTGWYFRDSALRYTRGRPGYPFPAGTIVTPGERFRLRIGAGTNSAAQHFWGLEEQIFENVNGKRGVGDAGYLFDPQGDLRATRLYPCMVACVDPLKGLITMRVNPKAKQESVTLINTSTTDLDLADYVLKLRHLGILDRYTFGRTFPTGSILGAGQKFIYRPRGKTLFLDRGGVIELRSDHNVLTSCVSWGFGRCAGNPKNLVRVIERRKRKLGLDG